MIECLNSPATTLLNPKNFQTKRRMFVVYSRGTFQDHSSVHGPYRLWHKALGFCRSREWKKRNSCWIQEYLKI